MILLKILGYSGLLVFAFMLAYLGAFISMTTLGDNSGSGLLVFIYIFEAFLAVVLAAIIAYFRLVPDWKFLPTQRSLIFPLLAFTIGFLTNITIYVAAYIPSYQELKKAEQQHAELIKYVKDNFANLTANMAVGDGPYIRTLLEKDYRLRFYNDTEKFAFNAMLKANYSQLVTPQTTPEKLLDSLETEADKLYNAKGSDDGRYSRFLAIGFVSEYWNRINPILENPKIQSEDKEMILNRMAYYFTVDRGSEKQRTAFNDILYSKHKQLIPKPQTTPEQFVDNLEIEVIKLGFDLKNYTK